MRIEVSKSMRQARSGGTRLEIADSGVQVQNFRTLRIENNRNNRDLPLFKTSYASESGEFLIPSPR